MKYTALTVCLLLPALAHGQSSVPAGTINDGLTTGTPVILCQDDPAVVRFASSYRDRLFKKADLVAGKEAAGAVTDSSVIVFGTPAHPWLHKHRDALPFRLTDGAVEIDGRRYDGQRLRVICALRNPDNPRHRAVVYAAARAEDLVNINAPFHGPTEWLVADGQRTLAAGSFRQVRLTVEQMAADLEELAGKVKAVHPAAVKALPPEFEAALGQTRKDLAAPLSRDAFGLVLNRLLQVLRDAHTIVNPLPALDVLDLPFTWIGDGMIVTADTGVLRKGDRLLRIGSRDEQALLELLRTAVPAENDHWARHAGEILLRDVEYLRALGVADKAPVAVTLERGGTALKVAVPLGKAAPGPNLPRVRFELDGAGDLGIFAVDACINDDFYKKTVKEFFDGVRDKKVGRIAIDVRRNGGGDSSVVNELLRYVDVEQYTGCGAVVRWSDEAKAKVKGAAKLTVLVQRYPQVRLPNSRVPEPFRGQVFVLTSKATFSSGNWFAFLLQDNKIAKVVGEPTGNAASSYGDIIGLRLAHSGLSYTVSYKQWQRPDPTRDPADCVTPDIPVAVTRQHIIDGVDPVRQHLRHNSKKHE
jgi:hypothetical protein